MLPTSAWLAFAPSIGLVGDVLGHLFLSRLTRGRKTLLALVGAFFMGLSFTLAVTWYAMNETEQLVESLTLLAFNAATYVALAYGYFAFVNLNISSIRIRVLQELLASPQGLSATALEACYGPDEMVEKRVERIIRGGQLHVQDGRLYTKTSIFVVLLHTINVLRWLILGKK